MAQEAIQEIIFVVRESSEGGFEAQAVGHSIFTEADMLEDLRRQVQDAVQCHFPEESRPRIIPIACPKFINCPPPQGSPRFARGTARGAPTRFPLRAGGTLRRGFSFIRAFMNSGSAISIIWLHFVREEVLLA